MSKVENEFTMLYGTLAGMSVKRADDTCETLRQRLRENPSLIASKDFGPWLVENTEGVLEWRRRKDAGGDL